MAGAIAILATVGALAIVFGGGAWAIYAYPRHVWVRRVLDAFARTVPSYYAPRPPRSDLPKHYTDQIPGWDDNP